MKWQSRLVRALWIEIVHFHYLYGNLQVEARESLVDWNQRFGRARPCRPVEARESLVDWNVIAGQFGNGEDVEARESLVDWNSLRKKKPGSRNRRGSWEPCGLKSTFTINAQGHLSRGSWEPCGLKSVFHWDYTLFFLSRLVRALWIEINLPDSSPAYGYVEARESLVDWNQKIAEGSEEISSSRLVRALWIKMFQYSDMIFRQLVEARESLVDWNSTTGSWKHLCRLYIFTTHLEILYNSQCYKENIFKREGESFYGKRY